jgi:hypothetical protein
MPLPQESGHWPVGPALLSRDINAHFDDNDNDRNLVVRTSANGVFIDRAEMKELGIELQEIADWLIGYTASDNADPDEPLPRPWRKDPDQPLFAAIMVGKRVAADNC